MISAWGVDHGQVSKGAKEWAIPVVAGATSSVIANQFPQNQTSWQAVRRRKKKKEQIAKLFKPPVVPKYNFKALGKVKLKKGPTFASPTKIDNGFTRSSADAVAWAWERKHIVKSYIPGKGYVPAVKAGKKVLHEAVGERQTQAYLKRAGRTKDQRMFQQYKTEHDRTKDMVRNIKDQGKSWDELTVGHQPVAGTKISPTRMAESVGGDVGAFAFTQGGRRGKRYVVVQHGANPHFVGHETAHVTPKRSSFRMYQIRQDKAKLMSEEGRASMYGAGQGRYWRNVDAKKGIQPADGYIQAATHEPYRQHLESSDFRETLFGGESQWSPRAMKAFKDTQDKIATAHGGQLPKTAGLKFHGNQWVDNKGNKRGTRTMSNGIRYIGYGVGSTGVGAGAIYASRKADQRAARKARSR